MSKPFRNPSILHGLILVTAPNFLTAPNCYLNQALSLNNDALGVDLERFPWVETANLKTVYMVVVKQSLGSWSHLWSLNNVSGCGSTSLFGSRVGTHQIRDQSRALEDRNDGNNSLEVYTPNSFIHLFYNSPDMDIVDMHNVIVTPSDSVL